MHIKKPKIIDLNFLSQTTSLMNKAKDFQSIAEIIFNFIAELVWFNMAVIYKVNEKDNLLEIVSCRGSDTQKMKNRIPLKIGEGAAGLVAKEKKALLINDALKSKEIKVRQFSQEDPIIRSFLAVPLVVGDNLIGILSVSCSKPYQYDEYDVEMITIIASQGAALLELNNQISQANRISNQILENVNSGVMVIDVQYKVISFNKVAENISGYSCEEMLDKNLSEIPLKESKDDWYIEESMKTGKIVFEHPGYMIRKNGDYVRIRLSTSIMKNEDGTINGCICIFRDNTEIEKLQRQIAMTDKLAAIGRLASGITHEIRNPLLPIRAASQFLLSKYKEDENYKEVIKLLSIINEESERLNRFLDQLTNLNKDNLYVSGEALLKNAIEETLILIKHGLRINKIDLSINFDDDTTVVLPYNKDNLKQIFLNLILNAIDAINSNDKNKPRKISINVIKEANYAKVEFVDSGCGIVKEELDKVFDPFYTTKDSGTGLGLPIIHNIVSSLGGKILIESTIGIGTKVVLVMPLLNKI